MRAWLLALCAVTACSGVTSGATSSTRALPITRQQHDPRNLPLPHYTARAGSGAMTGLTSGAFHAAKTGADACAWVGHDRRPFLWPDGYSVDFSSRPRLIDPHGNVVASEGQRLVLGGGSMPAAAASACGAREEETFYVSPLTNRR